MGQNVEVKDAIVNQPADAKPRWCPICLVRDNRYEEMHSPPGGGRLDCDVCGLSAPQCVISIIWGMRAKLQRG